MNTMNVVLDRIGTAVGASHVAPTVVFEVRSLALEGAVEKPSSVDTDSRLTGR